MVKLIEIIGSPGSGKTFISLELQLSKKNNEQVYFHSSKWKNYSKFKKLNILSKILIKLKVVTNITFFFLIFGKRLFLKKIYKRSFFFRIILLIYKDLVSIELLKKILPDEKYIIMEPGIIMFFLQDYFYSNKNITKRDMNIFNKFFLKTDYIICTYCDFDLSIKRLKSRVRGLPQRMRDMNIDEIKQTIKKSNKVIFDYTSNDKNLNSKIIKINTSNKIDKIKDEILNALY
jgi:hypothetical protein